MRPITEIVVAKVLVGIARRGAQIEVRLGALNRVASQYIEVMTTAQLFLVVKGQFSLYHLILFMAYRTYSSFIESQGSIRRCKVVLRDIRQVSPYGCFSYEPFCYIVA